MATFIKGKSLSITIDGDEYKGQLSNVVLGNEDADDDFVTFADVGTGGGKQWFITGTAAQSTDEDALWRYIWDNPGEEVPVVFEPLGASGATFTAAAIVGDAGELGGDADRKGQVFTFDFRFDLTARPTLADAA